MKTRYVIAIYALIFLCFCEKKEAPIPEKEIKIKESRTTVIEMGSSYKNQHYFNLELDSVVAENLETAWDVAFSCSEDNSIFLNTSHQVEVAITNETNFEAVSSASGLKFNSDYPSLHPDSLGFGKWQNTDGSSKSLVYVVNLGKDFEANPLGYRKFQITDFSNDTYSVKYSNLNGSNTQTAALKKDPSKNRLFLSFANGEVIIEPDTELWDLVFTQYNTVFQDPEVMNYTVTGVLHNTKTIEVAEIEDANFGSISLESVKNLSFSSAQNVIGYDWKSYDIDAGLYTIDINKAFIIKKGETYYKLRFLEFYNTENTTSKETGYPMIEYKEL